MSTSISAAQGTDDCDEVDFDFSAEPAHVPFSFVTECSAEDSDAWAQNLSVEDTVDAGSKYEELYAQLVLLKPVLVPTDAVKLVTLRTALARLNAKYRKMTKQAGFTPTQDYKFNAEYTVLGGQSFYRVWYSPLARKRALSFFVIEPEGNE